MVEQASMQSSPSHCQKTPRSMEEAHRDFRKRYGKTSSQPESTFHTLVKKIVLASSTRRLLLSAAFTAGLTGEVLEFVHVLLLLGFTSGVGLGI